MGSEEEEEDWIEERMPERIAVPSVPGAGLV